MNLFYAPPEHVSGRRIELGASEARHASRALRYRKGDPIRVTDGKGSLYEGTVSEITPKRVILEWEEKSQESPPRPDCVLGMGVIKKRDRLEFAVEKAVELGVSGIALFRSRHTVKENVRLDRLESAVLSAMKQSLRCWLPEVELFDSPEAVIGRFGSRKILLAHRESEGKIPARASVNGKYLLLVGPEGGFSEEEVGRLGERGARAVSLGDHRLRTETAAVVLLDRVRREGDSSPA